MRTLQLSWPIHSRCLTRPSQHVVLRGGCPPRLVSNVCSTLAKVCLSTLLAVEVFFLNPPTLALAYDAHPMVNESREEGLTIRFKASKDPAVRSAQEALVEAWGYTTTQFIDTNFNGVDWQQQLQVRCCIERYSTPLESTWERPFSRPVVQDSLDESTWAANAKEVYQITDAMLKRLGKPKRTRSYDAGHCLHCL